MSSRFDELFSPDRMRQNWHNPLPPVSVPTQNTKNQNIQLHYHALQHLITEKFPNAALLSVNLQNLTMQIELAFGLNAITSANAKQKQFVISLLEELEELLWAMELSQKKNP